MKVVEIKEEEFKDIIKTGKVVVDCFANWCGPCRALSPIVDQVAEENDNIKFYKLDVDNAPNVSVEYEVMSIPMLLIFEDGKLIDKSVGLISKEELENLIH